MAKFCPDCGGSTLSLLEVTDPCGDEYKEVYSCPHCDNMVHLFRRTDGPLEPPEGCVDHDDEDRRACREELNERRRPSDY
jgi:hypothetical protein